ncbi:MULTISPECIES: hypothetical protein [unclassified Sphingomonas]|uniref:hypothetical protein n=1 Tax=unclassified Sphingomonas TaxID=196159 RepID=UPI000B06773E|nr:MULTISPECIES: hypothetical protein [unclassified Sphingomonas]
MKSFSKIASSLAVAALLAAPIAASVPEAGTTLSRAAVKAIGSKMRAGMVVRLNKKVARKNNVELAQLEGAAGAGATGTGAGAGAGAAGAGAAGAGAAGAGAAAAGAGVAGGLGVAGAVAGVAAAAGVATAASSGGGDNSP